MMRFHVPLLLILGVANAQFSIVGFPLNAQVINLPELTSSPENTILAAAERLVEGQVIGPESFAIDPWYPNVMYSGLLDGRIVKFVDNNGTITVHDFVRTGTDTGDCGINPLNEPICGRPLGMSFDPSGEFLIAIDAYRGLLKYTRWRHEKLLTDRVTGEEDRPFTLLNALAIDEVNDDVYLTDTTRDWPRFLTLYNTLEGNPTGRLIKYSLRTGVTSVVLDGLLFPKGIEISHDGKHLFVSLLPEARIGRYTISTGEWNPDFISNLPALPDNIVRRTTTRPDGQLTYWLGAGIRRDAEYNFLETLAPHPDVREQLALYVDATTFLNLIGAYGYVLEFNEEGEVLQELQDSSGLTTWLSEAFEWNGNMYLGSFFQPTLFRVDRSMYV